MPKWIKPGVDAWYLGREHCVIERGPRDGILPAGPAVEVKSDSGACCWVLVSSLEKQKRLKTMLDSHDYGPPQKLRLVCQQTGKQSIMSALDVERGEANPLGGGHMWSLEEPNVSTRFDGEPGIVQSTGMKDAVKVEIYGGDVVARPFFAPSQSESEFEFECGIVVFFEGAYWVDFYSDTSFEELLYNELLFNSKDDVRVIGNRWQTRSELEAKTREVFAQ